MKIKRSIELPDILNYTADMGVVYLLTHTGKSTVLSVFDPLSFAIIDDFYLGFDLNYFSTPCVDEDCIYVPTNESQIFAIDKFSGDRVLWIDIGSMILSADIQQDKDSIYTLCGVPLSDGLKITTDTFCVSANDKKSRKKKYQSSSMMGKAGDVSFLTVEDKIWVSINKHLVVFDKNCQKKEEFRLRHNPSFHPIVTENFVICASNQGHLEIFERQNTKNHRRISVQQNSSPPICIGDVLYWFTKEGLLKIDISTLSVDAFKIDSSVQSDAVVFQGNIYTGDKEGNVIEFNIENQSWNCLKVGKELLRKPIIVDQRLMISSRNRLYEIEV